MSALGLENKVRVTSVRRLKQFFYRFLFRGIHPVSSTYRAHFLILLIAHSGMLFTVRLLRQLPPAHRRRVFEYPVKTMR
jgi:hypothetical protein